MKKKIETIYYIKGFAIFSVICAHCNAVLDQNAKFANISSLILQNLGTVGVICFFVISGALFHYRKGQTGIFFKKRIFSICIPWLFSATCVYFYVYLRKPPLSLAGWINFVIGNGSYCYYLTVLMILYLIFSFLPFMRTNLAFVVCEVVTAISTIWFYQVGELSPYLYVPNWIGYFALGMQMARHVDVAQKLLDKLYKVRWGIILIYIALLGLQIHRRSGGGYMAGINPPISWVGAITLILLAMMIEKYKHHWSAKMIRWSGQESFFIYIWHMPVAGIIARMTSIVPVRPVVVLFIMIMAGITLKWILKTVHSHQHEGGCFEKDCIFGLRRTT